jgi:hypothetical protein
MTNQRKVPSGYRIDADKKKWLQENGGITPLIDRALEEAGCFGVRAKSRLVCQMLMENKEALILSAIRHSTGQSDDIVNVKHRCDLMIQANGRELFSFDGKPMIQFYPPESRSVTEGFSTRVVFEQDYKLLYDPMDIGGIRP